MSPAARSCVIAPALSGKDLVATVPALRDVAKLDVAAPFLLPGASRGIVELTKLSRLAVARLGSPGLTETGETFDLLAEHGIKYVCDLYFDHQPVVP